MMEILQFDFMIRAFIAGAAIAIIAPLVGIFLVVRRYALMADTLAHVAFLGVVAGFLTGISPFLAAIGTSVLAVFGIEKLRANTRLPGDSLLALFLSGSLAIATVLISVSNGFNLNLFSFLFGSITTVSPSDLFIIIPFCILVIFMILLLYKELFFISLDEELAEANGVKTKILNTLIVVLAAFSVVVSIKIVGALLIGALMVIPVLAAIQFKCSFKFTIILSVVFSLLSVLVGIFVSYYLGTASGGAIVVIALIFFLLSMFLNKNQKI